MGLFWLCWCKYGIGKGLGVVMGGIFEGWHDNCSVFVRWCFFGRCLYTDGDGVRTEGVDFEDLDE